MGKSDSSLDLTRDVGLWEELADEGLQRARDRLVRARQTQAGGQRRPRVLVAVCRLLAEARRWNAPEWADLRAYVEACQAARQTAHPLACWATALLAERGVHAEEPGAAIALALPLFGDRRVQPELRLRAAAVLVLACYGQENLPEVQRLHAQTLALCDEYPALDAGLRARCTVLLAQYLRVAAEDGRPTPTHPFPELPPDPTLPRLREKLQGWLASLTQALAACPSGEKRSFEPLYLLAILMTLASGRQAAQFTIDRGKAVLHGPNRSYIEVAEAVCDYYDGKAATALERMAQWSVPALARLHEWPLSSFAALLQYRLSVEVGAFERGLDFLALFQQERERRDASRMAPLRLPAGTAIEVLLGDAASPAATAHAAPSAGADVENPVVQQALRFMKDHLAERLSVPHIVSAVGVSRRTLENAFREQRGATIGETLKQRRLEAAQRMLRRPDVDIASIRRLVGYVSASAFSRDFRAAFGYTPRDAQRAPLQASASPALEHQV